jgi:1-acyl-sn-glycerol-3-phosphate acyltransferase
MRRRLKLETFVPYVYWTATYLLRGVLTVLTRWEPRGRHHVPRSGPLIVVSNHLNNADPAIVGAGVASRRIRYMAKIELFDPPFGILIRLWGAFPVRRFGADVGALLTAERLLKQGQVLGMFPEGTRSRTGRMTTAHPGTALIALRTGAPVLPCAVTGSQLLKNTLIVLTRPSMTVTIGEPIISEPVRRPTEQQVSELTARIFDAITALLPPDYVGAYTRIEEASPVVNDRDNPRD